MGLKGEGGTTHHNPYQDQAERNKEGSRQCCGNNRKGRVETHDQVDQPDVVRLPDRSYRPSDQLLFSLNLRTRAKGEKVPGASSKVGSAKRRIENHRQPEQDDDQVV